MKGSELLISRAPCFKGTEPLKFAWVFFKGTEPLKQPPERIKGSVPLIPLIGRRRHGAGVDTPVRVG